MVRACHQKHLAAAYEAEADCVVPGVPGFIRQRANVGPTSNPAALYNFWAPERSGFDSADRETGRRHFATAVAFAQNMGSPVILADIIGEMAKIGVGPMEAGFLEALTCKALVARLPDMISDEMMMEVLAIHNMEAEIRLGERDARDCLTYARSGNASRTCRLPSRRSMKGSPAILTLSLNGPAIQPV